MTSAVEAAVIDHFGQRPTRASVSFVGVDRIEVLRFEPIPGERAFVTLGMSRHPMTGASASIMDTSGPRAELMLHIRDPLDAHVDVWRRLAVLAAAPAVEGVVYVEGMSIDVGEPLASGSACVGAVITTSPLADVDLDSRAEGAHDTQLVRILQAVPATANELGWCRVRGSAALLERWHATGTDLLDLDRRSVPLD